MMGSHSSHTHAHCEPGFDQFNRAFAIGVGLNMAYISVEAGVGLHVGSLALLADAGHNLGDVFGLLLAWLAHRLTKIPPQGRRTFGWQSFSIVAAVINSVLLVAGATLLMWESLERIGDPTSVPGVMLILVAGIGVAINAITAFLFIGGRDHDLNLRGAYLHMMADAAVSMGVVIGGLIMIWYPWPWIDTILTVGIGLLIIKGTWSLMVESMNLLVHAVPAGINPDEVREFLCGLEGVDTVCDMHIWALSTTQVALTAHLRVGHLQHQNQFLDAVSHELFDRFAIANCTIQIEV